MQYALVKRQLMYKMLEAHHMRQIIKTSGIYRFMPLQTMQVRSIQAIKYPRSDSTHDGQHLRCIMSSYNGVTNIKLFKG